MRAIPLCYTELGLAFPRASAPAGFPFETLGPWPSVRAFASYLEGVGYAFGWEFGIPVSALAVVGGYYALQSLARSARPKPTAE